MKQQHIILGRDRSDVETQCERWLAEHPELKILKVHSPMQEPRTLLTRLGGHNVPRVSIKVEFE